LDEDCRLYKKFAAIVVVAIEVPNV